MKKVIVLLNIIFSMLCMITDIYSMTQDVPILTCTIDESRINHTVITTRINNAHNVVIPVQHTLSSAKPSTQQLKTHALTMYGQLCNRDQYKNSSFFVFSTTEFYNDTHSLSDTDLPPQQACRTLYNYLCDYFSVQKSVLNKTDFANNPVSALNKCISTDSYEKLLEENEQKLQTAAARKKAFSLLALGTTVGLGLCGAYWAHRNWTTLTSYFTPFRSFTLFSWK